MQVCDALPSVRSGHSGGRESLEGIRLRGRGGDGAAPSVLIVGEQQILNVGVRHAVESDGLAVTGVARSHAEAVELATTTSPELCLLLAPIAGGVQSLVEELESIPSEMRVVVMSSEDYLDGDALLNVLASGAAGWLSLDLSPEVLGRTLRAVHNGEPGISRQHVGRLLAALRRPSARATRLLDGRIVELTPRERETLELLAGGLSTALVAVELAVSAATVRWHISSLVRKLGVDSRAEAVRLYRGKARRAGRGSSARDVSEAAGAS